ncbi:MAG: class E sortase [Patescibacteria group bacterium]|nr:class E sortase [Patescibacteria group bacterium]
MQIILYDSHWPKGKKQEYLASPIPQGETLRARPRLPLASFIKGIGNGLIVGALILIIVFAFPLVKQDLTYRLNQKKAEKLTQTYAPLLTQAAQKQAEELKLKEQIASEAAQYKVTTDFSLVIPKISAASKVIPNVNPSDEKEYKELLKNGVGHAQGTKFPGEGGNIYLFSHSTNSPLNVTRYNAVFYMLKELTSGDEVIIFYNEKKYTYKVVDHFITTADDVRWLTEQTSEERLVLQTCWPPGTSWKRLIVLAKPV